MAVDFTSMTAILHNEFGNDVTYTYHDSETPVTVNAVRDIINQDYESAEGVIVNNGIVSYHIKVSLLTRQPERKDSITNAAGDEYDVLSSSMDGEGLEYIIRVSKVDV